MALEAIVLRNDMRWVTPSGAFLELLQLVGQGKLVEVTTAFRLYFSLFNGVRAYVASALPGIILNNYQPLSFASCSSEFHRRARHHPDWSERIRDNGCSPRLVSVVQNTATSLQEFMDAPVHSSRAPLELVPDGDPTDSRSSQVSVPADRLSRWTSSV